MEVGGSDFAVAGDERERHGECRGGGRDSSFFDEVDEFYEGNRGQVDGLSGCEGIDNCGSGAAREALIALEIPYGGYGYR